MSFQPELGQALYGQPYKCYEVPQIVDAALCFIRDRLDTVMWNINQEEYQSPFSNTGNEFKCETFEVYAYSWGDEYQPYNFKWLDVEISWYKYLGRGMSANMAISPSLASRMLKECVSAVERLEELPSPTSTEDAGK